MESDLYNKSLELHRTLRGKLETKSKVALTSKEILSLAYSPGVAAVSTEIARDPARAREYTLKRNTVAIVSDGSAILGLGNLGPLAAIPVMEGKAAILKEFAGVDAFPICLDVHNTEGIIAAVKAIAPVFGGINLEDIAAPQCFEIEERLRAELSIPVMHDDQWGAATVTLAGLINALKLVGKGKSVKIVLSGVGAAGVATARLLLAYGLTNLVLCDSKGIIHKGRIDLTKEKQSLLAASTALVSEGELRDALVGADVFIGLSKPGVVTQEMVRTMTPQSIIFALANPTPEIMPEDALQAGAFVVATGRSDYPNQVNNSLVFPGVWKGALDGNLQQFTLPMFVAIAEVLAATVTDLTPQKIVPTMFDATIVDAIARKVQEL